MSLQLDHIVLSDNLSTTNARKQIKGSDDAIFT